MYISMHVIAIYVMLFLRFLELHTKGKFLCLVICFPGHFHHISNIFLGILIIASDNFRPEGRPGSSDASPLSRISGVSFDSIFLSTPLLFCLVLLLILSSCVCFWPSLLPTFQKFLSTFFPEIGLFVWPLFCFFSGWETSWSVVSVPCYLMALV